MTPQQTHIHLALLKLAGWYKVKVAGGVYTVWDHVDIDDFMDSEPTLDHNLLAQCRDRMTDEQRMAYTIELAAAVDWPEPMEDRIHRGTTAMLFSSITPQSICILKACGLYDAKTMDDSGGNVAAAQAKESR